MYFWGKPYNGQTSAEILRLKKFRSSEIFLVINRWLKSVGTLGTRLVSHPLADLMKGPGLHLTLQKGTAQRAELVSILAGNVFAPSPRAPTSNYPQFRTTACHFALQTTRDKRRQGQTNSKNILSNSSKERLVDENKQRIFRWNLPL